MLIPMGDQIACFPSDIKGCTHYVFSWPPLLSPGILVWLLSCAELGLIYKKLFPGGWFNIKMLSSQYRESNCGDKILWPSYLHNGISYTGKMKSLYWIRAQKFIYIVYVNCASHINLVNIFSSEIMYEKVMEATWEKLEILPWLWSQFFIIFYACYHWYWKILFMKVAFQWVSSINRIVILKIVFSFTQCCVM